jgi:hypothetical protein
LTAFDTNIIIKYVRSLWGREHFPTGGKVREPMARSGVIPEPTV